MQDIESEPPECDNNDKPNVVIAGNGGLAADVIKWMPDSLYNIASVNTGKALIDLLTASNQDLVLINSSLADMDVISVIQSVSSLKISPHLIVRSETDDEIDRIIILEIGADDCITLSCGPREIKARVRALLRRRLSEDHYLRVSSTKQDNRLPDVVFSDWILDRNRRQLYSPSGEITSLTHSEDLILNALFSEPGVVKDRSSLMSLMAGINQFVEKRSLDVFVSRLRKKIATRNRNDLIETVRGEGYRVRATTTK